MSAPHARRNAHKRARRASIRWLADAPIPAAPLTLPSPEQDEEVAALSAWQSASASPEPRQVHLASVPTAIRRGPLPPPLRMAGSVDRPCSVRLHADLQHGRNAAPRDFVKPCDSSKVASQTSCPISNKLDELWLNRPSLPVPCGLHRKRAARNPSSNANGAETWSSSTDLPFLQCRSEIAQTHSPTHVAAWVPSYCKRRAAACHCHVVILEQALHLPDGAPWP